MRAQNIRNVAREQLNLITKITGYKQFVLRTIIRVITIYETVINPESKSILELIKVL